MLLVYSTNTSCRSCLPAAARPFLNTTDDSPITSTSASTRPDPADARQHTHQRLPRPILRGHGPAPATGPPGAPAAGITSHGRQPRTHRVSQVTLSAVFQAQSVRPEREIPAVMQSR